AERGDGPLAGGAPVAAAPRRGRQHGGFPHHDAEPLARHQRAGHGHAFRPARARRQSGARVVRQERGGAGGPSREPVPDETARREDRRGRGAAHGDRPRASLGRRRRGYHRVSAQPRDGL
ncbi:MAG: hypothetical protein AVDCRST_MAG27-1295, partial [uncultured Craurococcus sp.]